MMPNPLFREIFFAVEAGLIAYVSVINTLAFVLTLIGYFALRNQGLKIRPAEADVLANSPLVPGISILAPAHNEELSIRESVRSMLTLRHPNHEVIVINDGSADGTIAALIDEFHLCVSSRSGSNELPSASVRAVYESRDPIRLVVIDKQRGGKADALNCGLNYARQPLVASVDSDSLLERDALLSLEQPFLEDLEGTVAVGGIIHVVNGCQVENGLIRKVTARGSLLAQFQRLEYLRAFFGGRVAFSFLDSLLLISGAFGLFRRDAVVEAGGFDTKTVGEDMELVVRLHKHFRRKGEPQNVVFVPDPVCWTEVPETLKVLKRQRTRWQRGGVQTILRHREMIANPRFGIVGVFGIPYFVAFEILGPVIELIGYFTTIIGFCFGWINAQSTLLFFLVSLLFGVFLSASAVLLEQTSAAKYRELSDFARLLAAAVIETFGYRQLIGWWRLVGLFEAIKGKGEWGTMERKGFQRTA